MVKNSLRNNLKKSYIRLLSPFSQFNSDLYFLYAHYVSKQSRDLDQVNDLLQRLNKKVAFIDFEEACYLVTNKKSVSHPVACFSFDDGFDEVVNGICPIIQDLGANPCVFVNPGFIDGDLSKQKQMCEDKYHVIKEPASWDDLSEFINKGGVVGSHTIDHVNLAIERPESAVIQIIDSRKIIEKKLNNDCKYFAWPYGTAKDINDKNIAVALDNYDLVFSAIRSKERFYNHPRVINRDHFEFNWEFRDIKYFLSKKKVFNL